MSSEKNYFRVSQEIWKIWNIAWFATKTEESASQPCGCPKSCSTKIHHCRSEKQVWLPAFRTLFAGGSFSMIWSWNRINIKALTSCCHLIIKNGWILLNGLHDHQTSIHVTFFYGVILSLKYTSHYQKLRWFESQHHERM